MCVNILCATRGTPPAHPQARGTRSEKEMPRQPQEEKRSKAGQGATYFQAKLVRKCPKSHPKYVQNQGSDPLVWGLERFGVPPKPDLDRDPAPEPKPSISGAPFLAILSQKVARMGGPFFLDISQKVLPRRPKSVLEAKNIEKMCSEKCSVSGLVLRPVFMKNGA